MLTSRPVRVNAAEPMLDLESFTAATPSPLPIPSSIVAVPAESAPSFTGTQSPKVESLGAAIVLPSPLAVSSNAPLKPATSLKLEPFTAVTPAPWTISADGNIGRQAISLPISKPALTEPTASPLSIGTSVGSVDVPQTQSSGVVPTSTAPSQSSLPVLEPSEALAKPVQPIAVAQPDGLKSAVTTAGRQNYRSSVSQKQPRAVESAEQLNPEQPIAVDKQLAEAVIANLRKEAPGTPASVHQVEPGDTLETIAVNYKVSVQELASTNRIINPDVILVGQALKMPSQAKVMPSYKVASLPQATSSVVSDVPAALTVVAQATVAKENSRSTVSPAIPVAKSLQARFAQMSRTRNGLQAASGAVSEQKPANTAGSHIAIVKRTILPQLARLELPPLAPVDTYLPPLAGTGQYISPAKGILTSGYGRRWGRMHRGIDIAAPVGTPVVASAPGVVVASGWNSGGYGKLVKIRHPDGGLTLYAHNNRLLARAGQQVDRGQQIAEMGSTGRSTGPHLHFEIHPSGRGAVNPITFLSRRN